MPGPKYSIGRTVKRVGLLSGPVFSWVEDWHVDALVVSKGNCPIGSTGKYSGTGDFYTNKRSVTFSGGDFRVVSSGVPKIYALGGAAGPPARLPNTPLAGIPSFSTASAGLAAQYATGYSKARPGNPRASVAQFIGELRDLPQVPFLSFFTKPGKNRRFGPLTIPFTSLPVALRRRALTFKNLGSEYLNYAFGWKPFVSDLRKMYNLWHAIDKQMAQIVRENGKFISRKATLSSTSTFEAGKTLGSLATPTATDPVAIGDLNWSNRYGVPFFSVWGPPTGSFPGTTYTMVTREVTQKEWFAGKFQYYIPDTSSSQWTKSARAMLFGAIPTPETVWELMPWSWLVDWFSNVGDVISNLSPNAVGAAPLLGSSGVNRTSKTVIRYINVSNVGPDPAGLNRWSAGTYTCTATETNETKVRIGSGNPFGLNVSLGSLSQSQLAVLAALGMSKGSVK